jgi:hypothetical protein
VRAKQGDTLRYFTSEDPSPFAITTSKQEPPLLLLACTPDQLDAPPGWATSWEKAGRLRTAVTISEDRPIEALAQLAAQVLKIMGRSE